MLCAALAIAGCTSTPNAPDPPVTPPAPTLVCPANILAEADSGTAIAVRYDMPRVDGGSQPVSISCTPPSNSNFPLGQTMVSCTGTDSRNRVGTCSFAVQVAAKPVTPPPPPPPPLTMSCPSDMALASPDGRAVPITYTAPQIGGGDPPVALACSPPSGSAFPIGLTTVVCNAADGAGQRASCDFTISIARPPMLEVTRFMAFGDSFTAGAVSFAPQMMLLPLATPDAYPGKLLPLIENRYTAQDFIMINEGLSGERAAQGVARLTPLFDKHRPEVLILMEGANDLNNSRQMGVRRAADALEDMVQDAMKRDVVVFLATLPPQRQGGSRAGSFDLVPRLNGEIREIARTQGAILVDLYEAFDGTPDPYIGADGLHPTAAGYVFIAQTFFDAIRQEFEDEDD